MKRKIKKTYHITSADEIEKNRQTIYTILSKYYGWDYNTIANMNYDQMEHAIEAIGDQNNESDGNLHFSTREEWELWRECRFLKGES